MPIRDQLVPNTSAGTCKLFLSILPLPQIVFILYDNIFFQIIFYTTPIFYFKCQSFIANFISWKIPSSMTIPAGTCIWYSVGLDYCIWADGPEGRQWFEYKWWLNGIDKHTHTQCWYLRWWRINLKKISNR